MDDLAALTPECLAMLGDTDIMHLGRELVDLLWEQEEYWGLPGACEPATRRTVIALLLQALRLLEEDPSAPPRLEGS